MKQWIVGFVCLAGAAVANVPDNTQRPQARPVVEPAYADVRPVARPVTENESAQEAPVPAADGPTVGPRFDTVDEMMQTPANAVISTSTAPADIVAALRTDDITGSFAMIAPDGPADASFRPILRPDELAPQPPRQPTAQMRPSQRPYDVPEMAFGIQTRALYRAEQNLFAFSPNAIAQSLHPQIRPAAIVRQAEERAAAVRRGQICGDPAIQGEALGNVPGPGQCGVDNGVRVRSVAGVTLTSRAVMDCRTATALKNWVVRGAQPAVGSEGGGLQSIRVIGTYSCRNRNSAANGRLSEHAFGHAIDIAGFGLRNGREISVLNGWNRQGDGARLRTMWQAACGVFGTVLGPNANRFHRDHFHFDTARYRSGSYCR